MFQEWLNEGTSFRDFTEFSFIPSVFLNNCISWYSFLGQSPLKGKMFLFNQVCFEFLSTNAGPLLPEKVLCDYRM